MWCAPHIEGQFLRDEITKLVTAARMPDGNCNWFHDVYALLEKHEVHKDWRAQFYKHATDIADKLKTPESTP
jgi:hypothetical protein